MTKVMIVQGELVEQAADVIVNPVRPARAAYGSVDHSIRDAAGPQMAEALAGLASAEGSMLVTPGFRLHAKKVIHVVFPPWMPMENHPDAGAAYRNCCTAVLRAVAHLDARSFAAPAIGVGVLGWPVAMATDLFVEALSDWIASSSKLPDKVLFVCASPVMAGLFRLAAEDWELPLVEDTGKDL